jgi:putative transcriptional regulator
MGRGSGTPTTSVRNHIRALRFASGEITQQHLAERVGVSRQTLNAIEQGKYAPSLEVAFRIARVLGRRLEEVFEYAESAPAD